MRIPKNPRYIISHLVAAVTPGEYVALTEWLRKYIEMKNGAPSYSTYERILRMFGGEESAKESGLLKKVVSAKRLLIDKIL